MRTKLWKTDAVVSTLAAWFLFASFPALAQNVDLGVDFLVGLPQNAFRDNVREKGYGLAGHIGVFIKDTPIMVGVDIGYLNYGTEEREEPLSGNVPDVIVDVKTTNNIFMLHGFARVQPQDGPVRPYFEGLWGFKYLFTRTAIVDNWYEQEIVSSTNFDDFAGSWGLGAGVDIRIWDGSNRPRGGNVFDISLNLSARYLWGAEAEYLKKGSIVRDPDGGVTYFVHRSKTDMLMPRIGIRVRF
jgi:hypothetical protein